MDDLIVEKEEAILLLKEPLLKKNIKNFFQI